MLTKRSRSGFTLPEILVTVTVIAVLAAVVVPAVTQYASRGDAPSAKSDVLQISTSITGFASDVRFYPGDLRQLTTKIDGSTTGLVSDASTTHTFTASDIAKWSGPYTASTLTASGYANLAGYQVQVGPALTFSGAPKWLQAPIVSIANAAVSCASLIQLDAAVDGSTNAGSEGTTGQIQWTMTSGVCTAATQTGVIATASLRLIPAP